METINLSGLDGKTIEQVVDDLSVEVKVPKDALAAVVRGLLEKYPDGQVPLQEFLNLLDGTITEANWRDRLLEAGQEALRLIIDRHNKAKTLPGGHL